MKTIPEFPQKRPIELEDKTLFDSLFKKYPPVISEFTFTNLFVWRHAYQFQVSRLDDFFLVISSKASTVSIFDPIGPLKNRQEVIRKCFSLSWQSENMKFIRLPGDTASLFRKSAEFKSEEDRDNFDYIYKTKDLILLPGARFDGKRNFVKRFRDSYRFEYKKLTKDNIKECLSFEEEWCLAKDCQRLEGLTKEKEALAEMLENFQYLNIKGGMIEIDGKVEAVSLGEALNPGTFVIHIEKASDRFIGIYQAINQLFCSQEAAGHSFINREQDLGVEGLRKAKESYHPLVMVKKYTLSQRG